jgi:DNA-directed RNA polymerase subunit RPC12/RpoP
MHWLIYTLVTIAALALLVWGWIGDRARGRRRCPKCWYDLRGSPTLRCPECGHVVWNERELYKPRRRKWAIILALLAL